MPIVLTNGAHKLVREIRGGRQAQKAKSANAIISVSETDREISPREGQAPVVIEPGFKGTWKIEEPIRKHFAIQVK